MLNTISHQGDANQNHNEVPLCTYWENSNKKVRQSQGCGEKKPQTLLAEMSNGVATLATSVRSLTGSA